MSYDKLSLVEMRWAMKTVLITGASKGIGKEIAIKFAENHYNVIINYNNSEKEALELEKYLIDNYHISALVVKCDISNEEEVKKMFNLIKEKYGSIDCLVNNAAIAIDNDISLKTKEEFEKVLSVNLTGTFLVTKYAINLLETGSIINVSSTNGIDTNYPESIDYDVSKAGVISLTHNFAKLLAPKVRVNCVAPGWVDTDMNKTLESNFRKDEEEKILLKRFASPKEIANVIYFLSSDEASYINNTVIRVDGGC